jgi:hypothetical protein
MVDVALDETAAVCMLCARELSTEFTVKDVA